MKIGIVGSGISGLTAAYFLNKAGHDVTVFEANDYIGGHTHTISVKSEKGDYQVDTGFIVFNEKTYPLFTQLLKEIDVPSQSTNMSFSVHVPASRMQYSGNSLNGLFADRLNIVSPRFYRLLYEIKRFQGLAKNVVAYPDIRMTVADFLTQHKFHAHFSDWYLYPLVSSLWSSALDEVSGMPIYFVAKFFDNHALLKTVPDLPWKVIQGGSSRYVDKLIRAFASRVYVNTPVKQIIRHPTGIQLLGANGELGDFDKVVLATHSDQALQLVAKPSALEERVLSAFRYASNEVVLHTDTRVLPPNKRAWASWNYWVRSIGQPKAVLTYDMNRLQNLNSKENFCVTLNATDAIDPEKIIRRFNYSHPQYSPETLKAQSLQAELNRQNANILYCGAYWGFGFHEDGVRSALDMCRQEGLC